MLPLDAADTIAAIASAPGPALRGIVRLSGPKAIAIATARCTPDDPRPWTGRAEGRAGRIVVTGLSAPLAARLIVWPERSFTGQPSAEIHVIGSPPILDAILADCLADGARLAEPGEFTLRAFLSGRIDLTRAEAVLGVIEAKNAAQLRSALEQLGGGIASPIESLRDRLLDVLAHLEADLDFVDESDVNPIGRGQLAAELAAASKDLVTLADRLARRDRSESRPKVVLHGPPNAGKSRLFNALVGGQPALVSDVPGTTRDYLSASCQCGDIEIELIDTSGVESPRDEIERVAHAARDRQVESADLLLLCRPAGTPTAPPHDMSYLRVATKSDLATAVIEDDTIPTSAATGAGLSDLRAAIADTLRESTDRSAVAGTSARCRDSLIRAGESLQSASRTLTLSGGDELVAIDLRQALDDLGRVVGAIVTDDVLDRIFRRFCIGK